MQIIPSFTRAEDTLPVLRVTFPALQLNDKEYIFGQMSLQDTDGNITELSAKFRIRGATAKSYAMKPSFNMKLREPDDTEIDANLLGLRECSSYILDAMAIDRICMRNRVSFDIWNAYSRLPYDSDFESRNGTVGAFVELYMNDVYKGIYCLTDRINRKLLDLKKPQVDEQGEAVTIHGALYKHGTLDILNQDNVGMYNDGEVYVVEWHDAWELKEPEDYLCLEAWLPLLDFYDNADDYEYISSHFYLENIVDYTLLIMGLSISDNWGNKNKYLSIRDMAGTGDKIRLVVTPWDLDTAFGGHYKGEWYDGNYLNWDIEDIVKNAPKPFSTCLQQDKFKSLLRNKWLQLRERVFNVDSVNQRLYDYCDLFERTGAWQRQCDYWSKQEDPPELVHDLRAEIDQIAKWYENRFKQMDEYFAVTPEDTGISVIKTTEEDIPATIYNMQGIPVSNPTAPGVYISKGKKIML